MAQRYIFSSNVLAKCQLLVSLPHGTSTPEMASVCKSLPAHLASPTFDLPSLTPRALPKSIVSFMSFFALCFPRPPSGRRDLSASLPRLPPYLSPALYSTRRQSPALPFPAPLPIRLNHIHAEYFTTLEGTFHSASLTTCGRFSYQTLIGAY